MVTPGVGTATLCQPKVTETRSPVLHVAPGLRGQSADFPAPVTTRSHGSQHGDCATLSLRDRGDEDDPPPPRCWGFRGCNFIHKTVFPRGICHFSARRWELCGEQHSQPLATGRGPGGGHLKPGEESPKDLL